MFHHGVRSILLLSLRQTDLAGFKIEGRAVVHIGIRDSIVHVESRKTALTAIVSVATTNTKAKTRNSSKGYHPAYQKACRKINNKYVWKEIKERFFYNTPIYVIGVLRTRGALCPTDT